MPNRHAPNEYPRRLRGLFPVLTLLPARTIRLAIVLYYAFLVSMIVGAVIHSPH